MRLLIVFLLSFIMTKSCDKNAISDMENVAISYEEMTRGYQQNIVINKEKIVVDINKRGEKSAYEKPILKNEALEMVSILNQLNLKEIESYPAPSNKSRFDGAAMAKVVIKKGTDNYSSQTFDAGNPPKELATLVEKIIQISKK